MHRPLRRSRLFLRSAWSESVPNHGAQVEPVQEVAGQVPVEVEEEEDQAPSAQAPPDEAALQVDAEPSEPSCGGDSEQGSRRGRGMASSRHPPVPRSAARQGSGRDLDAARRD